MGCYCWYGDLEAIKKHIAEQKGDDDRPICLDAVSGPDGTSYFVIGCPDQDRPWKIFYTLEPEEVVSTIEEYQAKGWRPDVLTPYLNRDRLRFMLVLVDNSDRVDWRFRLDMSLSEYQKESAKQKRQGLFPLALGSYGQEVEVQYVAVWVRYRDKME